ncbi:RelA/SpoT domain-containing protein [Adlercreutzia mucosicola]|jgi:putative GTP pyrophosphokinase|uniref:RelA/SpoT domain-containing protein n=1 Tax=Adlercreutzia mucosicola TaxID=580026 RepID=UPI0009FCFA3E|nr:RelA/SpoT domain-containing protein [Adlercreutzia mucosicola]MCI9494490.1 RelA/SpoT domain-containing protein [Adlercreutzia mucosicola]MCR2035385.1 RelA/SpoT domain-containing protein [Adlercreutzia mucosicola]
MTHYSKKDVRRAGKAIIDPASSFQERREAEAVVNFWRDCHRLPLQRLLEELNRTIGNSPSFLIAGRIKKLDTIIDKMTRRQAIANLAAMDDIAGCRIIVPNLAAQEKLCLQLSAIAECDNSWSDRHNYIASPKESGYRGRHMLFRYHDEQHGYKLTAELQVRTEYQHAWATAVEMYDAVANDRLKFGEGENRSNIFFQKVSALLRQIEESGEVDRTSIRSLGDESGSLRSTLSILKMLSAASQSVYVVGGHPALAASDYCLVDFDPAEQMIVLTKLSPEEAFEAYFSNEDDPEKRAHNLVLLRGASIEKLAALYPNYFGDISKFVNLFNKLIEQNLDAFA